MKEVGGVATGKITDCSMWNEMGFCSCPNLRPYIPHHFQLVETQGHNSIRFSGGSGNIPLHGSQTGSPFEIKGDQNVINDVEFCNSVIEADERDGQDVPACQQAIQYTYQKGKKGGVVGDTACQALLTNGWSYFHAAHNHWHASSIYEFTLVPAEVCTSSPSGLCPGNETLLRSNKVTYCLVDSVSVEKNNGNSGNTNTNNGNGATNSERIYWDCATQFSIQGLSVGWMDQYHQALPGMDFDITSYLANVPSYQKTLDFFVVATANPDCFYWEEDFSDNVAFVGVRVFRSGNGGNWGIKIISGTNSDTCCWDSTGANPLLYQEHLCGEGISNH
jgi:hypothetical protein